MLIFKPPRDNLGEPKDQYFKTLLVSLRTSKIKIQPHGSLIDKAKTKPNSRERGGLSGRSRPRSFPLSMQELSPANYKLVWWNKPPHDFLANRFIRIIRSRSFWNYCLLKDWPRPLPPPPTTFKNTCLLQNTGQPPYEYPEMKKCMKVTNKTLNDACLGLKI